MTTLVDGGSIPVGSIIPFGGTSANVPDGFLLCNGALLNRNDFSALFDVIGTQWGTNSGTDFRVPTTQGLLLRGTAYGSGFDPDRNSRTAIQGGAQAGDQVGSYQTTRYGVHSHGTVFAYYTSNNSNVVSGVSNFVAGNGGFNSTANRYLSFGANSGPRAGFNGNVNVNSVATKRIATDNIGSNQSVGANVYVNYIIKY